MFWLGTAILTFAPGVAVTLFRWERRGIATRRETSAANVELSKADSKGTLPILAYCELANNPEKYNGQTTRGIYKGQAQESLTVRVVVNAL